MLQQSAVFYECTRVLQCMSTAYCMLSSLNRSCCPSCKTENAWQTCRHELGFVPICEWRYHRTYLIWRRHASLQMKGRQAQSHGRARQGRAWHTWEVETGKTLQGHIGVLQLMNPPSTEDFGNAHACVSVSVCVSVYVSVCVSLCACRLFGCTCTPFSCMAVPADSATLAGSHLQPVSAQSCTGHQGHHSRVSSCCQILGSQTQVVGGHNPQLWAGQFWACKAQVYCQPSCYRSACNWFRSQKEAAVDTLQCYRWHSGEVADDLQLHSTSAIAHHTLRTTSCHFTKIVCIVTVRVGQAVMLRDS